jgi:hypothetical protein
MKKRTTKKIAGAILLVGLGFILLSNELSSSEKMFEQIDPNAIQRNQSSPIYEKSQISDVFLIRYRPIEQQLVIVFKDGFIKIVDSLSGAEISSQQIKWSGSKKADMDEEGRFMGGLVNDRY